MSDPVKAPAHYAGDGEVSCMRAMESMHAGWGVPAMAKFMSRPGACHSVAYLVTCAFKYLWRWPLKGGLQDLEKARRCLDYAIERMGGGPDGGGE